MVLNKRVRNAFNNIPLPILVLSSSLAGFGKATKMFESDDREYNSYLIYYFFTYLYFESRSLIELQIVSYLQAVRHIG